VLVSSLFRHGYSLSDDTRIEHDDFRGNRSFIDSIVKCVHYLDDRISRLQTQHFPVRGLDRELPAYQQAGIDHRMTVSLEPRARRDSDSQNRDLGLTLRIRNQ
jgi:hypothetical protein